MADADNGRRIIDQEQAATVNPEDFFVMDSSANGTRAVLFTIVTAAIETALNIATLRTTANGAMQKSVYDRNADGIVDNAAALEGHAAAYFATAEALTALRNKVGELAAGNYTAGQNVAADLAALDTALKNLDDAQARQLDDVRYTEAGVLQKKIGDQWTNIVAADTAITAGGMNPATSGAVYTAVQAATAAVRLWIAPTEDTATAAHAYERGAYFYLSGVLYRVTEEISIGDEISTATNVAATTVSEELTGLAESIVDVSQTIGDLSGTGIRGATVAAQLAALLEIVDLQGDDLTADIQAVDKKVDAIINSLPYFDSSIGEYTNESISRWLSIKRDGLAYGVQIPKSTATAMTKLGANAAIERPTLAIGSTPGADPYIGKSPFFWMEVNAYIDPDGTAHVTAIKGDKNFSRHNQTWILTPVLYEHIESDENYIYHYISDTKLSGYTVQPSGKLPNGNLRPFVLYAKYALGYQSGGIGAGYANTITGLQPWCYDSTKYNVFPSHNGLISIFKTAETGYSGRDTTDDWYLSTMFAMKYATKNSQTYFKQCNSYYYSYAVTVAEADTQRVIISKANAANLVPGSAVSVGANRNRPSYKIVSIEEYDSSNSAVNLDMGTETITTDTAQQLHTQPWHTGACDMLETDGAAGSGDKYPAMLQGIEFGLGMYETMGNVIIKSDGSTGWKVHVNKDSRKEATTLTADYTDTGLTLYANTADSWKYGLYLEEAEGMFVPQGSTGSTSAGLCDGQYTNKLSTAGEREWLALGGLNGGGNAGLRSLNADNGLGGAYWYFGSRASANGRRG